MVCPNDVQLRQNLETLYQRSPALSCRQQFAHFLRQIGTAIVHELTRDRTEPRISRFYDSDGKALWHVYDPLTQKRLTTASEGEVREWLEQRYRA